MYQRLKYWCTSILSWGPLTLEESSGILKTQVSSHIDMIFTTMPPKPVFQQNRQLNESELTLPVENCPFKGGVFFGANQENRNDRFTSWAHPRHLVGPPEVRYEPVLDLFFSRKLGEFLKEPRQGQTMFLVLDGHCSGQVHCKSRKRNREQKLPVRTGKE